MSHLGDRVAALVDDQLPPHVRERLLAHVAACPQCQREVEAARQLKQRLATLATPQPSLHLTQRLVAMSEPGEPMTADRPTKPWARRRPPPVGAWRDSAPPSPPSAGAPRGSERREGGLPAAGGSDERPPRGDEPTHRVWGLRRAAAVAVSVSAATLGVAFAVGGEQGSDARPVVPPVQQFVVEHAATSHDVPLSEPAVGAVTVGGGTARLEPASTSSPSTR